jgi:copper resistance protein C
MRILSLRTPVSFAFALFAAQAFAHAQLQKATPAVGGTVSPPSEIRLQFGEGVKASASKVTLAAAHGAAVSLGAPSSEPGNDAVLIVPIAKPLAPGPYTVHWHAVAADDGGKTQGSFSFTVK